MLKEKSSEYSVYEVRCKDVMEEKGVRFAAIGDKKGNLISGGFKVGITPLEGNEDRLQDFMKYAAEISLKEDFNRTLGALNYAAFRRDKVILIIFPFPLSPNILLVSAEPTVNIEKLAERISTIFGGQKLFSEWDMTESI